MFFDDNNNYFDIDKNNYIDFNSNNVIFNRDNSNYTYLEESFNNGNLFKNIYSKYKNHVYKLRVKNERDILLYKIQIYNFALNDLSLYLDIHQNDKEKLKEFLLYKKELAKLKDEYNTKYGILCKLDIINTNRWQWSDNPWPWDNKNGGNSNV